MRLRIVLAALVALTVTRPVAALDLPEGQFAPTAVFALRDGIAVRSDAGFVHRALFHLRRDQEAIVDGRAGLWLHLRPQGWVLMDEVRGADEAAAVVVRRIRVTKESARVRSGPGTDAALVRSATNGEILEVQGAQEGWWELVGGGFIHQGLAEEIAVAATPGAVVAAVPALPGARPGGDAPAPDPAVALGRKPARWSLLDLNGVVFEVSEVDARSPLVRRLRKEMDDAGGLESNWTFLRLVIGVPDGIVSFHYSPDVNATVVVDDKGQRYGNIHARGPVERLSVPLRALLDARIVKSGEVFEGMLLFRPTLDPVQVRTVHMAIGGRLQELYASP